MGLGHQSQCWTFKHTNQLINVIQVLLHCLEIWEYSFFTFYQQHLLVALIVHLPCVELPDLFQLTSHWLFFHHKPNMTPCRN